MRDHHCDPDEAARIFMQSESRIRVSPGLPLGNFSADRRAVRQPVARLKAALYAAGIDETRFRADPPGSAVEWA